MDVSYDLGIMQIIQTYEIRVIQLFPNPELIGVRFALNKISHHVQKPDQYRQLIFDCFQVYKLK